MGEKKGISGKMIVLCVVVLVVYTKVGDAKSYMVGGQTGWNYTHNMTTWPNGKSFRAGDILVFYYITYDNVVIVDKDGYNSCRASKGSKKYESGYNEIPLVRGPNYFICTNNDRCRLNGMKIAVNAV